MSAVKEIWFQSYFKTPLILLVLSIFLGVAVATASSEFRQRLSLKNQHYSSQAEHISEQLRFLKSEQHLEPQYRHLYQYLKNSGVLGAKLRVKWTDELLVLKDKLQLQPMRIRFGQEKRLTQTSSERAEGNHAIYVRRLELTMGMQSDLDILTVFQTIRQQVTPVFTVNGCRIKRHVANNVPAKFNRVSAPFLAKCSVTIYRVSPKPFKTVEQKGAQ